MVLRFFSLAILFYGLFFSSIIYLVKSHRKPFSSMLVFVFHRAPGLAKVCQNSWAVNDSNVQSSISKIRTTIDFCTIDVAVLTMLPSWSWLQNSRRRVGHVSDVKCNGYHVLRSYPGIVTIFLPLLKYLNSCCFNKLSFAPSFGKSFLPGWLPYTLHSPWARHLLSTTVGLCERIMTSKVRTAKGSDHRPAKVVEPPWKNRLVPNVKVIKTTIRERARERERDAFW